MFTINDIAEYYNTTQIHYENWWDLKNNLSLHYGIWEKETKIFSESLTNTNRIMMELAHIIESDKVLDAGCGVGGAALFLSTQTNAQVIGISISQRQVEYARLQANKRHLGNRISFQQMDYANTSFNNDSFDVIWACESISSAPNKLSFVKEAHRLLKKGGRLILSDFFLTNEIQVDEHNWMKKWGDTWSISNFISAKFFIKTLENQGFSITKNLDFTAKIHKSAKRIYYAALLGALPSWMYNIFHPSVSRFAKTHYLSGYYQYRALKAGLWRYNLIVAVN